MHFLCILYFRSASLILYCWCHEHYQLCSCLPPIQIWTSVHNQHCGSVFFILLYCFYVVGSWFGVVSVIWTLSFPPFFRVLSTIEQVVWVTCCCKYIGSYDNLSPLQMRLCMKSYSFIRENAYKVIYPWNKDDKSGILMSYYSELKICESNSWQGLYVVPQ